MNSTPRMRTRYMTLESAREGMVLAEAVRDAYQRMLLPSGAALTDENLQQLRAHHIEFVCVSYVDARSAQDIAVDSAATARRVLEIFETADLGDPVMAALFNQVLTFRSA
jgi:hypothetical protein